MGSEWIAVACGLGSAIAWGSGDFVGGVATKRSSVFSVVFLGHLVSLALVTGLALVMAEQVPPARDLFFGALAGIGGNIGVTALYLALSRGPMGIVAPVAAVVNAAGPVAVGLILEGVPAEHQLVGFGLALVGVWLVSRTAASGPVQAKDLILPVVAGLGFSLNLIFIDQASNTAVLWPLVVARLSSSVTMLLVLLLARQRPLAATSQLPLVLLIGLFDVSATALFAVAAQQGRLDIAAVLSSLYPASTVLLAWTILKERIARWQWVGIAITMASIILIAY